MYFFEKISNLKSSIKLHKRSENNCKKSLLSIQNDPIPKFRSQRSAAKVQIFNKSVNKQIYSLFLSRNRMKTQGKHQVNNKETLTILYSSKTKHLIH